MKKLKSANSRGSTATEAMAIAVTETVVQTTGIPANHFENASQNTELLVIERDKIGKSTYNCSLCKSEYNLRNGGKNECMITSDNECNTSLGISKSTQDTSELAETLNVQVGI